MQVERGEVRAANVVKIERGVAAATEERDEEILIEYYFGGMLFLSDYLAFCVGSVPQSTEKREEIGQILSSLSSTKWSYYIKAHFFQVSLVQAQSWKGICDSED